MPARVAPITRSAGSTVRGVSRRHRYTTTSTATNDAALSANTSAGPLAATRMPPRAGPIARPMLMGSAFSATARISSDDGTSSAVIACQVGVFIATPIPSAKVKASSIVAVMTSANASTADHITDLEADGFDGGREVRRDRPVGSELPVHPGPPPRLPGRARDGHVRLDVDGVRRRFTPLQACGYHQRQVGDRLDGN